MDKCVYFLIGLSIILFVGFTTVLIVLCVAWALSTVLTFFGVNTPLWIAVLMVLLFFFIVGFVSGKSK